MSEREREIAKPEVSKQSAVQRMRDERILTPSAQEAQADKSAETGKDKSTQARSAPQRLRALGDRALALNRLGALAMGRMPAIKNPFDRGR